MPEPASPKIERVPPTLTSAQAASRNWSVVVVGAGPAGAAAAIELARSGVEVLLVDRATFPRGKVCGCCINGAALAALEELNLAEKAMQRGLPIERIQLMTAKQKVDLQLNQGVSLSRDWLDAYLVQAAINAGAEFLDGVAASLHNASDDGRHVRLSHDHIAQADVVVVADGLSGSVLKDAPQFVTTTVESSWIGAGAALPGDVFECEAGVIYMACTELGYAGMVKLEDGRIDIASAMSRKLLKQHHDVAACIDHILTGGSSVRMQLGALQAAQWKGTPQLTRSLNQVAAGGVLVAGDAAGYVEPFTGEGIAWALRGGITVARIIRDATGGDISHMTQQWKDSHRRLVKGRQSTCRWAASILKRPWLTSTAIAVLRLAPWMATPFIRSINQSTFR